MKAYSDIPVSNVDGEDLYPEDEDAQRKIVAWVQRKFIEAERAKAPYKTKWEWYYKMYRSYVRKRKTGEWRSNAWIPVAFYVIETIVPRLAAQLPDFTVNPVGPEDVQPAETMEELLKWATDKSDLYLELVKAMKSTLMYGTGILKVLYEEREAYVISREPVMMEHTADVPTGVVDVDGNPITQTVSLGAAPTGEMQSVRTPYTEYAGPVAEAVDIANFFPDPMADDIDSARYVIHRVYRDKTHLQEMFKKGIYKKPPEETWNRITENAMLERLDSIELGSGTSPEAESGMFPLLEVWTDDVMCTVVGERGEGALLRVERNPFAHGKKPFIRIVDHLVPHEFWGIGELEPLEGIQDVLNTLWNSRIDNVKLVLNAMFVGVEDFLVDIADLQTRPGGVVRVREGIPANQAVQRIDMGDVTSSAYTEAAEAERMSEKVTGVSPYQTGQDSPAYNRTATGVALISEQGNTRFSHKVRMAELTGFKHLARQYASILQQFMPDQMVLRIKGPDGFAQFKAVTQDAIVGRFDFDVEAESSAQTESIRREQTLSLFQALSQDPYAKPLTIRQDLLKVFGRKNIQDYLYTPEELQMMMAQQQQQMGAQQGAAEQTVAG